MITITGVELDFEKMLEDEEGYTIYFTSGVYETNAAIRTIEPAIIRLNINDYTDFNLEAFDIYYKPQTLTYSIIQQEAESTTNICPTYGIQLGGFVVNGCNLSFTYPKSIDVRYVRAYEDVSFDEGYENESEIIDITVDTLPFTPEFSPEFAVQL